MKIIIAEHSGFCFGVKRAVDMTVSELKSGGPRKYNHEIIFELENEIPAEFLLYRENYFID